jgi:hypothetical protein
MFLYSLLTTIKRTGKALFRASLFRVAEMVDYDEDASHYKRADFFAGMRVPISRRGNMQVRSKYEQALGGVPGYKLSPASGD